MHACVSVRACVCACVRVCVRACVPVHTHACRVQQHRRMRGRQGTEQQLSHAHDGWLPCTRACAHARAQPSSTHPSSSSPLLPSRTSFPASKQVSVACALRIDTQFPLAREPPHSSHVPHAQRVRQVRGAPLHACARRMCSGALRDAACSPLHARMHLRA